MQVSRRLYNTRVCRQTSHQECPTFLQAMLTRHESNYIYCGLLLLGVCESGAARIVCQAAGGCDTRFPSTPKSYYLTRNSCIYV